MIRPPHGANPAGAPFFISTARKSCTGIKIFALQKCLDAGVPAAGYFARNYILLYRIFVCLKSEKSEKSAKLTLDRGCIRWYTT